MFKKIISVKTHTEAAEETDYLHNSYRGEDPNKDLSKCIIVTDILLSVIMFIMLGIEIN